MEKVTMKEIKKSLSLNKKIKVTGHKIFGFTKSKFEALKKGCQKSIEKVKKMVEVPKEIQKEEKDKQIAKIKEKIDEKQELINRAKKDKSVDPYYVKMLREEKKKLENKRKIKRKKGLGVFTLAKLTLIQIKNNSVKKASELKDKIAPKNKLNECVKKILELQKKEIKLKQEIASMISENPELRSYYIERMNDLKNNEDTEEKSLH